MIDIEEIRKRETYQKWDSAHQAVTLTKEERDALCDELEEAWRTIKEYTNLFCDKHADSKPSPDAPRYPYCRAEETRPQVGKVDIKEIQKRVCQINGYCFSTNGAPEWKPEPYEVEFLVSTILTLCHELEEDRRQVTKGEALANALLRYGKHLPNCAYELDRDDKFTPCDCGLVEVLAQWVVIHDRSV